MDLVEDELDEELEDDVLLEVEVSDFEELDDDDDDDDDDESLAVDFEPSEVPELAPLSEERESVR